MNLTHRFAVPQGIDETWAAINDLELVAGCFPGATLSSVDDDDFTGAVKVKLGPIALFYNGTGQVVERDPRARTTVFRASGIDKRGKGTASVTVRTFLTGTGSGTNVEVRSDLSLTGKPAQFGAGVVRDVSDRLLDQFVSCFGSKLADGGLDTAASRPTLAAGAAAGPLGQGRYAYTPPKLDSRSDLDAFRTIGPVLAKRYAPALLGALTLLWLILRLRRKS